MLSKWSLGKKIGVGFGTVLILLCGVATWSVLGIGGIVDDALEMIVGNQLKSMLVQREVDHMNWAAGLNAFITDDAVTEMKAKTDPKTCSLGKWLYSEDRVKAEAELPGLADILATLEGPHRHMHESAKQIKAVYHPADMELGRFLRESKVAHLEWARVIQNTFLDPQKTELNSIQTDPHKCFFGEWLYGEEARAKKDQDPEFAATWQQIESEHKTLHQSAATLKKLLIADMDSDAKALYLDTIMPSAEKVIAGIDRLIDQNDAEVAGAHQATEIYTAITLPNLHKVKTGLHDASMLVEESLMSEAQMLAGASQTKMAVAILGGIALVLGVALGLLITRSIVSALTRVMQDLGRGGEQVSAASGQVAEASQDMAEGASHQASNLEEASATLEEMSAMTRQNASNTAEADKLTSELQSVAQTGQESMERMTGAIEKIKESANQTATIIKTIDEIAFQTNLLALNAAVEAARAGDAGKGFAVVAEEVRNLAQRSAEAARNTADLIDQSQVNANGGVQVTQEVTRVLAQISESAGRVSDLVGSVNEANQEQSRSVTEINTAMTQLDNLTQSNAANAEETASASEELSGQARELNVMVRTLGSIIQGGGGREAADVPLAAPRRAQPAPRASSAPAHWQADQDIPAAARPTHTATPQDVIPLDEEEMIEL